MSNPLDVTEKGIEQPTEDARWGKYLREVREANNISVTEVIAELRFELKLLQQIETEDLANLPPAPFVKGYLRNYARMLNVDVTPVLAAYSKVCGADAPGLTNVSRVRELSSSDTAPRSTTWVIVAVLVISIVVWWWSQIETFKNTAEEVVVPESVQSETVDMAGATNGDGMMELALPELAPSPSSETDSTVVVATIPTVATAAESNLGTITLKFTQDSWVDITDAKGERLFVDLAKADTTRAVSGQPPFKVLLGNSLAVKIEYNSAPFDHHSYENKGIARFTLGSAE